MLWGKLGAVSVSGGFSKNVRISSSHDKKRRLVKVYCTEIWPERGLNILIFPFRISSQTSGKLTKVADRFSRRYPPAPRGTVQNGACEWESSLIPLQVDQYNRTYERPHLIVLEVLLFCLPEENSQLTFVKGEIHPDWLYSRRNPASAETFTNNTCPLNKFFGN